jgi:uncharacterized protein (DUF488 family)
MNLLYTIGHSTHPVASFIVLLTTHQIAVLTDVRSYPASRRWPQFNQEALRQSVEEQGIRYRWFKALGGRRRLRGTDSQHVAWEVAAFRAYADYAESADFRTALTDLTTVADREPTAIMCAEGLWWQCHRRIIADHLTVRGWEIRHITPNGQITAHQLPVFASIRDGRLIYDGGQAPLDLK